MLKTNLSPPMPERRSGDPDQFRFRRILFCVDRSTQSENGLSSVVNLARSLDAPLSLLHVFDTGAAPDAGDLGESLDREMSCLEARRWLDGLEHSAGIAGVEADVVFVEGASAERILEASLWQPPTLLVVSRQGAGHAVAYGLGSTAQKVITQARGSAMILPAKTSALDIHDSSDERWKRIVVPLDSSVRAECVLPTAVRIARDNGAELVLVHVLQSPQLTGPRPHPGQDVDLARRLAERNRVAGQRYLEHLADRLRLQHDAVRTITTSGNCPREALTRAMGSIDSDFAIVSAHGATGNPTYRYGSLAMHLIHTSDVPLLVLQDMSPRDLRPLQPSSTYRFAARHTGSGPEVWR